jgi:hypothetical protein
VDRERGEMMDGGVQEGTGEEKKRKRCRWQEERK